MRWDYRVLTYADGAKLESEINGLSAGGYEIIAYAVGASPGNLCLSAIMKRPHRETEEDTVATAMLSEDEATVRTAGEAL
jgi:hypothetical protein